MQAYDIIMLVVVAAATLFGFIKGFAWQIASLASIVVSYFVAYRFRDDVAQRIQAEAPWNMFLAMLLLYAGSSFAIWFVFRMVSGSIDRVRLRDFDRQMGAAFGLAKGSLYCLLITMFAMTLLGARQQQAIVESRSGRYISSMLTAAQGVVLPSEIESIVRPHLERVREKLNGQNNVSNIAQQDPRSENNSNGNLFGGQGGQTGVQPSPGNFNPSPFPQASTGSSSNPLGNLSPEALGTIAQTARDVLNNWQPSNQNADNIFGNNSGRGGSTGNAPLPTNSNFPNTNPTNNSTFGTPNYQSNSSPLQPAGNQNWPVNTNQFGEPPRMPMQNNSGNPFNNNYNNNASQYEPVLPY